MSNSTHESRVPGPGSRVPAPSESRLAFVFPGQGSQSVGMLGTLAEVQPEVRETFAEASAAVGFDLWALSQDGPEAELNRTENTQPALLAAGVAVWRCWLARGGTQPALMAGHSLGEYTALVCAGAMSLADAARLVQTRGRLMQAAVSEGQGAMAAVLGAEDALVEQVCAEVAGDEVVQPANYNSPGQIVIAGHAGAVDRALAALGERGVRKTVKLAVSVPSHCALMREAADALAEALEAARISMPEIAIIHNVTAQISSDLASLRQALAAQLHQPVRWTACVQALAVAGVGRIAECGPGKVLTGLVKRIDRGLEARALGGPDELAAAFEAWA
ncbi:MAG TPA: ACP S-malonyltransferase [Xanthomonadaceae bacterium]|nr:ACP S-malonyltransferase [Xanthomonadaceae bacterium]